MSAAPGIADRLLALEAAVAELRAELQALVQGVGCPAPTRDREVVKGEPSDLIRLAQLLGNARLAAVLVRAGYTSPEAVMAAPDEALLAIDGLGERALKVIREKVV
jgi:hypothetical protein